MFQLPRFIKRFIRKHTQPKTKEHAFKTRTKLSVAYALITWHLLGLVVYKISTKDDKVPAEQKLSSGRYYADMLGIKNATLVRYIGFTKVGEWDLQEEKKRHGKLLSKVELANYEEEQQLMKEQGDQQQHQESDFSESEDLNVERPL